MTRRPTTLFDEQTLELRPKATEEELQLIIRAVYRQVLGNQYVMESERLIISESQLKRGEISVREFVRQVAKSELYQTSFFTNCPRYRFIELNYKHLLGRAPDDYSETSYHSQVLDQGGFEAEINSYLDSDEYQDAFGENLVPFYRGGQTQVGRKLLGFTNMRKLVSSISTSDRASQLGNRPVLDRCLIHNNPGGSLPVTNIKQLLNEVLKPKPQVRASVGMSNPSSPPQTYPLLQNQYEEQVQRIESLQKQLAELQPLAFMGNIELNKWKTYSARAESSSENSFFPQSPLTRKKVSAESYQSLQGQLEEQTKEIANLEEKIAEARRLAPIGAARLNKWRTRSFF